jgi:hypothetical protein
MDGLSRETFFAVAEMVAGHLRLKEADRWSSHVCKLKFHSFTSEFPEVMDAQFMWAAEQWIQGLDASFHRYPTWRELMAPLYRCEGTLANRSWGPREGLPGFVRFKPAQLALLPDRPRSMLPPPDSHNAAAYDLTQAGRLPALPAEESHHGLTDDEWQAYLQRVQQEAPCSS